MKKLLMIPLLLSGGLFLSTAVTAHPPVSSAEIVEKMTEKLDLSEAQAEDVSIIMAEQHAKFEDLRALGRDNVSRDDFRDVRQETRQRLAEVLTEDQLAILDEHRRERKQRMRRFLDEETESERRRSFEDVGYRPVTTIESINL